MGIEGQGFVSDKMRVTVEMERDVRMGFLWEGRCRLAAGVGR